MVPAADDGPPISVFLDSNESAFGPGMRAVAAARAAAGEMHRYVENQDRILVPELASHYRLDRDRIAIGCGSDDLLARICRAYLRPGDELLRSANSYLKVPNYAHSNDATPVAAPDHDFTPVPDSLLAALTDRTRIVYLANPDNPSGSYLDAGVIRALHAELPGQVVLIIDCAYFEYVEIDDPGQLYRLVEDSGNVVMTRTFSKVHGLAGARIGWAYGPPPLIDAIGRISTTFPLATPSIATALAAMDDRAHAAMVVRETSRLRRQFADRFAASGITVHPSQGNFLLLEFTDRLRSADGASRHLRRRGISLRRFAAPSYGNCLRVTLGFERELELAAEALEEFMQGGE